MPLGATTLQARHLPRVELADFAIALRLKGVLGVNSSGLSCMLLLLVSYMLSYVVTCCYILLYVVICCYMLLSLVSLLFSLVMTCYYHHDWPLVPWSTVRWGHLFSCPLAQGRPRDPGRAPTQSHCFPLRFVCPALVLLFGEGVAWWHGGMAVSKNGAKTSKIAMWFGKMRINRWVLRCVSFRQDQVCAMGQDRERCFLAGTSWWRISRLVADGMVSLHAVLMGCSTCSDHQVWFQG